eukprot:CAMPEP_0175154364 /NCGR_PEP_ID=MMETSP0087-20121206/20295_1 /TAXON_ID=136419 /ORGANISM="Unknown Unknown, Strain D1" /LENGTH=390 /DNA_ID=CAMNT_0016441233 /DNA_START=133 /DNA_END=1302 /DNA_ORIENTATION=+
MEKLMKTVDEKNRLNAQLDAKVATANKENEVLKQELAEQIQMQSVKDVPENREQVSQLRSSMAQLQHANMVLQQQVAQAREAAAAATLAASVNTNCQPIGSTDLLLSQASLVLSQRKEKLANVRTALKTERDYCRDLASALSSRDAQIIQLKQERKELRRLVQQKENQLAAPPALAETLTATSTQQKEEETKITLLQEQVQMWREKHQTAQQTLELFQTEHATQLDALQESWLQKCEESVQLQQQVSAESPTDASSQTAAQIEDLRDQLACEKAKRRKRAEERNAAIAEMSLQKKELWKENHVLSQRVSHLRNSLQQLEVEHAATEKREFALSELVRKQKVATDRLFATFCSPSSPSPSSGSSPSLPSTKCSTAQHRLLRHSKPSCSAVA